MRKWRALIVPSIVTLSVAGSMLAGSAIPVAATAAHAPSTHVQVVAAAPQMGYRG
jgi:hypothetical protein